MPKLTLPRGCVWMCLAVLGSALAESPRLGMWQGSGQAFGQAPADQFKYLEGHTKPVYAVRASADGKTVATASLDGTVNVWDLTSGQLVRSIPAHSGAALSLAISRDGKLLATGGLDKKVNLYDVPSGTFVPPGIGGVPGVPLAIDVSANAGQVLTLDQAKVFRLWDLTTNAHVRDFGGITGEPIAGVFAPATKSVLAASADGAVRSWQLDNAQPNGLVQTAPLGAIAYRAKDQLVVAGGTDGLVRFLQWPAVAPVLLPGHNDQVNAVTIAANGKMVLSGSNDQVVQLYNLADNKLLRALAGQVGPVTAVALDEKAELAASGSLTGTIKLWQTSDGADRYTLAGHTGAVTSLAFQPKTTIIASAGADGTLRLWNPPTPILPLAGHAGAVPSVVASGDGKILATASADKTVKLWSLADNKLLRTLPAQPQPVQRVALDADGGFVAAGDAVGAVRVLAGKDGAEQGIAEGHVGPITGLAFRSGGKQLVSSGDDGTVRIWNLPLVPIKAWPSPTMTSPKLVLGANRLFVAGGNDGAVVGLDPETYKEAQKYAAAPAPIVGLALAGDGGTLVGATNLGGLKVWNAADGKELGTAAGHEGAVASVTHHPSLPQIATGGADGTVRLWRYPAAVRSLEQHKKPLAAVSAAANGKLLATSAEDMSVQLWSLPDGKPTIALPTQPAIVNALAVKPDGSQFVTGDATGTLRVWNAADGAPLAAWGGHAGAVQSLSFDTAGGQLVSSAADGSVALWKLPTTTTRKLHERPAPVAAMVASADGKLLAVASADKSFAVVDVAGAKAAFTKEGLATAATSVAFAADASLVAVGSDAGNVQFYKAVDGAETGSLGGHTGAVAGAALHPKTGQLATAGADGTLRLWDAAQPARALSPAGKKINVLAASPNGALIATATDEAVQLWTAADGKVARPLAGHKGAVTAIAWKTDSAQLVTAGADGTVRVWNAADGKQVSSFEGHKTPVVAVSFTTDGAGVVSATADKLAQITAAADAKPLHTLTGHTQPITALAAVPGGALVLSGSTDATVRTWTATDGKPGASIAAGGPVVSLAVSGDGKLVAVGLADKSVKVFQVADGKLIATHAGHAQPAASLAWNAKNTRVASASADGLVRVWDAATGVLLETITRGAAATPTSVSFVAPDERLLAIGWSDGQSGLERLRLNWVISAATGAAPIAFVPATAPTIALTSVAFTPDGASLVTGGADKKVQLWNTADGKLVRAYAGATDIITSVAVSADGMKVAAGGVDKAARVWNLADAAVVSTLTHQVPVRAVRFSGDATRLATGADDNLARVWSLPAGRLLQRQAEATKPVTALAFAADNQSLTFASADGIVRNTPIAAVFNEPLHTAGATFAVLAADGKLIASGGADKLVKITDATGKPIGQMADATAGVRGVALRSDGLQVAASSDDAHLYLWKLADRALEKKLPLGTAISNPTYSADKLRLVGSGTDNRLRVVHVAEMRLWEDVASATPLRGAALLPDGTTVVAGGADNKVYIHSLSGTGLLTGHTGPINGLAYTPDGKGLVSASADKTVRHWNPVDGKLVRPLAGHADVVTSVVVTTDGTKIVAAGGDKTIRTWNVADGVATPTPITATTPVRGLAAATDPTRVAGFADDGLVHLWDLTTGKELQRFTGHKGAITSLHLAADGKRIFSASADKSVARWTVAAERVIVADAAKVHDLALVGDGTQFVTSGEEKLVKLWDGEGKLVRQFGGAPHGVRSVAVSSDGATVAAGGDPTMTQPTVWVWNVADAKPLQTITTPAGVTQIAFGPDGRVAIAGADRHVRVYGTGDGKLLEDFLAPNVLLDIAYVGEKRRIAAGGADNVTYLLTPSLLRAWPAHVGGVASLAFTADGAQLVSAGADKLVTVWNTADGKKLATFGGHTAGVNSVALSADGAKLVAGGADKTIQIYDRAAASESPDAPVAPKSTITHTHGIRTVALSADGKQILAGGDDNMVWSWDAATLKEREHWVGHTGAVLSIGLSPDGKSLVSGSIDRSLRKWSPNVSAVATAAEGPITQAAVAPEENLAFIAGPKGTLVAIAPDTLQVVRKFAGAEGAIKALAVSRDGKFLAAGTEDSKLHVWRVADGTLLASTTLPAAARSLAVGAEAAKIAVACGDKTVRNYTLLNADAKASVLLVQQGHGHTDGVVAVGLGDEDKTMVSVSLDRTVKRWPTTSAGPRLSFAKELGTVYGLDFSPNGKLLGIASGDKSARVLNVETGEQTGTVGGNAGQVAAIGFRNNEQFVTATIGGAMRMWGVDGAKLYERTDPQLGNLRTVGFSNDGKILAVGGTGRVVQLWDVSDQANQTVVHTLRGHNGVIRQAVYNPAGTRLTTLDETGQVFVWDPSAGTLVYHQQLPLGFAYGLAYSTTGTEWFVVGSDPRVLRVTIPPAAQ